ncbi:hypothetical protein SAMN02745248_00594 [Hathewaya proteolytica DSM 3090]|uniref:Uncharacterized protein n=1 Tax=Hathewaya proteolytica DSM 3090 TaxID=1121331 RepID=A0A1M6L2B3_9CLOT|nr:hypothetical protein [Hathewaya proteolytica]SHJ65274.1 hypothetical protein SAMN02745248_00594 [Hathewaya proteolytica DSM 3090]
MMGYICFICIFSILLLILYKLNHLEFNRLYKDWIKELEERDKK